MHKLRSKVNNLKGHIWSGSTTLLNRVCSSEERQSCFYSALSGSLVWFSNAWIYFAWSKVILYLVCFNWHPIHYSSTFPTKNLWHNFFMIMSMISWLAWGKSSTWQHIKQWNLSVFRMFTPGSSFDWVHPNLGSSSFTLKVIEPTILAVFKELL